jgi:hypothetical protein
MKGDKDMYKRKKISKKHQETKNLKKYDTIVVDGHPEVYIVYQRQEKRKYYNCMADKEANVIVLR